MIRIDVDAETSDYLVNQLMKQKYKDEMRREFGDVNDQSQNAKVFEEVEKRLKRLKKLARKGRKLS